MPHPCVVCGRSRMNPNNRVEEYIFFGFPVNDEPRCKKWLEFCCREELYKLSKKQLLQRMVCSKHFLFSDFVNDFYDRLNSTAVPKLYDPKQSLYNISCVLCGRFRKDPPDADDDGATFHHFPGEEFRCLKWLDFVGVDSYYRLTRKEIMFCYICSKHFKKNQFVPGFNNRLIDDAVPSIKNPDENEDNENSSLVSEPTDDVELFNYCPKEVSPINPLPIAVLESRACAACGRLRSDPKNKIQKFKFHPFPAYEIGRCLKWCKFLGREDILKMSPNQIRRLVLCSGHFQIGQNFNGNGPCDAVPTIHEDNNGFEVVIVSEDTHLADGEENKVVRASVSSKKPKQDPLNKPAPLAKKRGKSKRPTCINIPKADPKVEGFTVKKLPIPTTSNWKLIANQFQPITVSNNLVTTPEIKKVILPFTGDISKLGAPIPVNSLASIPPGLLIKINLPDQDKTSVKPVKKTKRKGMQQDQTEFIKYNFVKSNIKTGLVQNGFVESVPTNDPSEEIEEVEGMETFKEKMYVDNFEEKESDLVDEQSFYKEQEEDMIVEETQPKLKMSARCRRTLIPIQCELRRFLNKLKPHVKRLPKKSKAQVKLAIVNMVIDRL
ncbi:THAP domain containing protein [Nasonia vitripennis]|uniref:THAP-type domain-containing protein n=1 Tax=Nasonia vitripennis TaxID=7425 RepID=A0A7M6UFB6_NASVI|nr:THAP domain containing protein [Nasonia vitripennis]